MEENKIGVPDETPATVPEEVSEAVKVPAEATE